MEAPKLEPWIETYTGKHLHFLDPHVDEIDIEDIAHALSNECRFGGHTRSYYSVAEHCVLVATYCPKGMELVGLLHDASEAYLRDIASPIKQYLTNYSAIEEKLMQVIFDKFGIQESWHNPGVKEADTMALKAEARTLLPSGGKDWLHLYPTKEEAWIQPRCFTPAQAKQLYLEVFNDLTGRAVIWTPEKEIVIAR
jgi:hypothetical protein